MLGCRLEKTDRRDILSEMQARTKLALFLLGDDFWAHYAKLTARIAELEENQKVDELHVSQIFRQLAEQFLVTLDNPEEWDEVRSRLEAGIEDMKDQAARLQEHLP